MHVSVTRPRQTETDGLRLPVVYVTSPYFAGTGVNSEEYFWDPSQELGAEPKPRKSFPAIKRTGTRPIISKSHQAAWVPRGYVVVHSSSPGTGLSQGCPTIGGDNESLAPKAVVDWLCGRAKGFTLPQGGEPVFADWCTGKVGMTGTSFNGTLCLSAATTGVDGLEAIIPIAPNTSYYHYYRSNGLIRHPGGFIGEDIAPIETDIDHKMNKVSIFMNVFNVHVNRSPVSGEIEKIIYKNGKFFNASLDVTTNFIGHCSQRVFEFGNRGWFGFPQPDPAHVAMGKLMSRMRANLAKYGDENPQRTSPRKIF